MNFCPNCGAKNENPDAIFCSNCGFKFANTTNESQEKTEAKHEILSWEDGAVEDNVEENRTEKSSVKEDRSSSALNEPEEIKPLQYKTSFESSSKEPVKKSISAFDDEIDTSADLFIVPKTTSSTMRSRRSSRERTATNREQEFSSIFDDEDTTPSLFQNEKAAKPLLEETEIFKVPSQQSVEISLFDEGDEEPEQIISSKVDEIKRQIQMQEATDTERPRSARMHAPTSENIFGEDADIFYDEPESRSASTKAQRPSRSQERPAQQNSRPQQAQRIKTPPMEFEENPYYEDTDPEEYEPNTKPAKKHSNGIGGKVITLVVILAVLILGIVIFNFLNTPEKTIETFVTAVENKDVATLKKVTRLDNIPTATDANWLALANGLSQNDNISLLEAQLTDQITNPKNVNNSFPAVRLVTKSILGIFKSYQVAVTGVSLSVPNAQTGTVLELDGVTYSGTLNGSNLVFSNIMPGLYSCQLVGANGAKTEATTVSFYTNNDWGSGPLPDGNVTPTDNDTQDTGEQTPSESTTDALTAPSADEINTILASFYSSYLNCINEQSTGSLTNSTEAMRSIVDERMKKPGNQANTFKYVSATCDASTISLDGSTVTVTGTFKYDYTPREDGDSGSGENIQKIQLVYTDGAWLVNSMENA